MAERAATGGARRRAERSGRLAESLCAWWLRAKGYRIVGRGLRLKVGEIDILARRGGVLAVVEVKRRASREAALEAVAPRQRRRILRAAEAALGRDPRLAGLGLRFDVMLVMPWAPPRHIIDAWRP